MKFTVYRFVYRSTYKSLSFITLPSIGSLISHFHL
ncbi:hypothetical protein Cassandra_0418 [Pseudomonas phage Cassandra]|nr:hypothetical protein Cassandra_0418 [Pseudomonas phage Cassandra]